MSNALGAFYRGRRVLVTGHTGFTGGWLVAWLKILGAKVCGYGLPPSSRPNFFDATILDRGITSIFADIRDRDTLANTFADFQPEIIFHAAAHCGPSEDPLEVFGINVTGTLNVLEEARLTGSAQAIVVLRGSQPVIHAPSKHGKGVGDWNQASHLDSQASARVFAESFFRDSRTSVAVANFPALIGGGDWNEWRFVPVLVHGLMSGQSLLVQDGGTFGCLHVLEAARACLHLGEEIFDSRSAVSRARKFSPPGQNSVSELDFARKVSACWGAEDIPIEIRKPQNQASPAKASRHQHDHPWTPALSLDQAIVWTVDWYKAHYAEPASAWRTTEDQIEQFAKLRVAQSMAGAATRV
jgi:CDP-glucose 4,6-dehydratase